jgi:hypothetical protein
MSTELVYLSPLNMEGAASATFNSSTAKPSITSIITLSLLTVPSERKITIDITNLYSDEIINAIDMNRRAMEVMNMHERATYQESPGVFDALAQQLLVETVGDLPEGRVTEGFKAKLLEWYKLLVVKIPIISNVKAKIKLLWTRNIGLKHANNANEIVKAAIEHAPELGDNFKRVMAFAKEEQRIGGEISVRKHNPFDKTQVELGLKVN